MPKKITLLITSFLFIFLVFAPKAVKSEGIQVGEIAPDFSIKRFDTTEFKLSEYRGKKSVYVIFWTTWCTYCMKKIPKLQHAQQAYNDQIEIIAINTSMKDTFANALKFERERNIKYPLAFDFGKKVTDLYGVWGTPTEFIIDINGKVVNIDQVPEDISEHLSSWNRLNSKIEADRLIATDNCNKENSSC